MLLIPPALPHDRVFTAPGTHLCGMAWDGIHLWHSDADSERIYRLDPEMGRILGDLTSPPRRPDRPGPLTAATSGRSPAIRSGSSCSIPGTDTSCER